MAPTSTLQRTWYAFARLPSGELLEPGKTVGCPAPDPWGACPAMEAGREPGCAGATWFYGPEPYVRTPVACGPKLCPLALLERLGPLD